VRAGGGEEGAGWGEGAMTDWGQKQGKGRPKGVWGVQAEWGGGEGEMEVGVIGGMYNTTQ